MSGVNIPSTGEGAEVQITVEAEPDGEVSVADIDAMLAAAGVSAAAEATVQQGETRTAIANTASVATE